MNKGEESKEKKTQRTQERRPVSREERMRRKRERLKRRRRILIAMMCAALVILILIIAGIVALVRHFTGNNDSGGKDSGQASDLTIEEQEAEKEAETEPVSITISAAGDCTLGTDEYFDPSTSLNAYYDSNGPEYFFQNVKSIFDADDLTIVNMEGTLTEETARQDKTYAFKGPRSMRRY